MSMLRFGPRMDPSWLHGPGGPTAGPAPTTGPGPAGPDTGPGAGLDPDGRLEDLDRLLDALAEAERSEEEAEASLEHQAMRAWVLGEDDASELGEEPSQSGLGREGNRGRRGGPDSEEVVAQLDPAQAQLTATHQYSGNPEGLQGALQTLKNVQGRLSAAKADAEMQALKERQKASLEPNYRSEAGRFEDAANRIGAALAAVTSELSKLENEASQAALAPQAPIEPTDDDRGPPPGHAVAGGD